MRLQSRWKVFEHFWFLMILWQTEFSVYFSFRNTFTTSKFFGRVHIVKSIGRNLLGRNGSDDFSKNIIPHSGDALIDRDGSGARNRNSFDNRDFLPFTIYHIDKPLIEMGTFILDSSTACGDVLELGERGIYKVTRVIFLYKHDGRKYRVVRKKLEVSSTSSSNKSSKKKSKVGDIPEDSDTNDGTIEEVLLSNDADNNIKYLQ